jgi:hypothetical protein
LGWFRCLWKWAGPIPKKIGKETIHGENRKRKPDYQMAFVVIFEWIFFTPIYYPNTKFLEAQLGGFPSQIWRAIHEGIGVLNQVLKMIAHGRAHGMF